MSEERRRAMLAHVVASGRVAALAPFAAELARYALLVVGADAIASLAARPDAASAIVRGHLGRVRVEGDAIDLALVPRAWAEGSLELLVARFIEAAPFADLVRPGIRESGSIHDHRFDLVSSVLVGKVRERVFETTPDADGDWQTWHVENARSAGVERGFDGDCSPLGATMRAKILERIHYPGDQYTLARHVFHETRVDELAVTLCTMRSKRGQARLLVPRGREPVHAFGAPASNAVIQRVLVEAHEELVR